MSAPIIHKVFEVYKLYYSIANHISKRDRFGIYARAEKLLLENMELLLEASFANKSEKLKPLLGARIKIEAFKRFVRLMKETNIIQEKHYLRLTKSTEEISKMTNGWIKYLS